jgi:hypothetical protein
MGVDDDPGNSANYIYADDPGELYPRVRLVQ